MAMPSPIRRCALVHESTLFLGVAHGKHVVLRAQKHLTPARLKALCNCQTPCPSASVRREFSCFASMTRRRGEREQIRIALLGSIMVHPNSHYEADHSSYSGVFQIRNERLRY